MNMQNGYTAISTVLVILAVMTVISVTISAVSIDDMQSSLSYKKADETLFIAEACAEDALIYLNENNALPASVTLPEGSCTITLNSVNADVWDFSVDTTLEGFTKTLQIIAERTNQITIQEWREI